MEAKPVSLEACMPSSCFAKLSSLMKTGLFKDLDAGGDDRGLSHLDR